LKYAIEVERRGSITKAAEKLYMNQPHLSKAIRELEEMLGIPIFKRTSRGMLPTARGSEFLGYAKNILAQLDIIEHMASGNGGLKTLSAAVPRASYISYAFTEYVKTLPPGSTLAIDYRETNSLHTIQNVANGESNLGIIRFPEMYESYFTVSLQEKDLNFEVISRFEYLILLSEKHPLAKEETIDPLGLGDYIEITHGDANVPSAAKSKNFSPGENGKREIAIYERGSQLELLGRIPSTYMWVSPMPEEVLSTFGLVQRRCGMPQDLYKDLLIYRDAYRFSDEDRAFVSKLRNVVKEVLFFQGK
jgi:DNA-binding transcriptional LysR family regulator